MPVLAFLGGGLCLVLGMVVLAFADGLRRWYSGIFLALVGTVTLINAIRLRRIARR